MKLERFVELFLKKTANVTLANMDYGIYFSGLVKNLPKTLLHGEVFEIEGLGSENDLIITVQD